MDVVIAVGSQIILWRRRICFSQPCRPRNYERRGSASTGSCSHAGNGNKPEETTSSETNEQVPRADKLRLGDSRNGAGEARLSQTIQDIASKNAAQPVQLKGLMDDSAPLQADYSQSLEDVFQSTAPPAGPSHQRWNSDRRGSIGNELNYTAGPAKVEYVQHGAEVCGALLLTLELSAKIERAISYQRRFFKELSRITRQRAEIKRFEESIRDERLYIISATNRVIESSTQPRVMVSQFVAGRQRKVEVLQKIEEYMVLDRRQADMQEEYWAEEVQEMAGYVLESMDEIFVKANMMDPADREDATITIYDRHGMFQEVSEEMYPPPPRPETPKPRTEAEINAEELWHEFALPFWSAVRSHKNAKKEVRSSRRVRAEQRRSVCESEGSKISKEAFDKEWDASMKKHMHMVAIAAELVKTRRGIAEAAGCELREDGYTTSDDESG